MAPKNSSGISGMSLNGQWPTVRGAYGLDQKAWSQGRAPLLITYLQNFLSALISSYKEVN